MIERAEREERDRAPEEAGRRQAAEDEERYRLDKAAPIWKLVEQVVERLVAANASQDLIAYGEMIRQQTHWRKAKYEVLYLWTLRLTEGRHTEFYEGRPAVTSAVVEGIAIDESAALYVVSGE